MPRGTGKYGSAGHRNLAVLKYLVDEGTWKNPSQIGRSSGGFNPADVTKILNDFLARKYIKPRPAENPQAKTEYHITEIGRETYESFKEFLAAPGRKHMLGMKEDKEK